MKPRQKRNAGNSTANTLTNIASKSSASGNTPKPESYVFFGSKKITTHLNYASTIPALGGIATPKTLEAVLAEFKPTFEWRNGVRAKTTDIQSKSKLKKVRAMGYTQSSPSANVFRNTHAAEEKFAGIYKMEGDQHGVFSCIKSPKGLAVVYGSDLVFDEEKSTSDHKGEYELTLEEKVAKHDALKIRNIAGLVNHSHCKEVYDEQYWFASQEDRDLVEEANIAIQSSLLDNDPVPTSCLVLTQDISEGQQWLADYGLPYWLRDRVEPDIFIKNGSGKKMDRSRYLGPMRLSLPGVEEDLSEVHLTGKQRKEMLFRLKDLIASEGDEAKFTITCVHKSNKENAPTGKARLYAKEFVALLEATEKSRQARSVYKGDFTFEKHLAAPIVPEEKIDFKLRRASADPKRSDEEFKKALQDVLSSDKSLINATSSNGKSPLHWAAEAGLESRVLALIAAGADKTLKAGGKTAYDLGTKLSANTRALLQDPKEALALKESVRMKA